ncbi:MAG: glycosyltransferase [Verrucomicrobia bacterium]|nr:glycosyltransferase [Verrucomicrobiota bacterium]
MLKVHFTAGDGKGWALDEDLRQIRASLTGMIRESGVAVAEVIHAPFWQNLSMVAPDILKRAFVIAHADNPPFFYLKQPDFLAGQQQVDLWVARSREAFRQFEALGLPAVHIPYTIDPGLFFPIEDKAGLRREFGIPGEAYVIANFHRDTEGGDLKMPKVQKNPEFMMAILRRLKERGVTFHVLLAGPRRHWIREALGKEGMPFTFVGKEVEGDDFGTNILDRATLNRLYNAADLYLIPSRWEGGPQSAMEAAACRCKILSVPIGVGRDILESKSLFRSSAEAAQRLEEDIRVGLLDPTVQPQFARWQSSHTTSTLKQGLQKLYQRIPSMDDFCAKQTKARPFALLSAASQILFTIRRRISRPTLPAEVSWNHQEGSIAELDRIMRRVETMLHDLGIAIRKDAGAAIEIIGLTRWRNGGATRFQWVVPGIAKDVLLPDAFLISPSVQDVLNLRSAGCRQPAVAIPFLESMEKQSEEPCVIAQGNRDASLQVWEALVEGRSVIYPENSAYYEQVFHAGLAYGDQENPESLADQARQMSPEFRELRYIPSLRTSASLLGALLRGRKLL